MVIWASGCKWDLQTSRKQWMWLCWQKQEGNLVKSLRLFVSCSGIPWREYGDEEGKGAFIAWSLQRSALLSIPTGILLTLQKCCWGEKRHCTPGHPLLSKPSRQEGPGAAHGMCCCNTGTWSYPTPQGLQLYRALEHFHFNRRSPKCLLQKWLSLCCVWLWIEGKKEKKNLFYLLASQMRRKSWGFLASVAYPPRGCWLFPLEDTSANSCINHVCCEQNSTSGFIMPY